MKKNTRKTDIIIVAVLVLIAAAVVLVHFAASKQSGKASPTAQNGAALTPADFDGRKMGILTGSVFEPFTMEHFPDSEYSYYNNVSDMAEALSQRKIDGFLGDEPVVRMMCSELTELGYFKEPMADDDYCFGFQKDSERADKLRGQFNEMLAEFWADGTMEEIQEKWFGEDESAKTLDLAGFSGENGTVKVAATTTEMPIAYFKDGQYAGIAIELAERFCRKYGYTPEFSDVETQAAVAAISSGKYDFCASPMSVTEERKESINFADPFYHGGVMLAVRADELPLRTEEDVRSRPFSYYAENGKVGAITGGLYEVEILRRFPDADVLQFNAQPDLAVALSEGKIDAFTCPVSSAEDFMAADDTLTYLDEVFMEIPYGFAFQKTGGKNELRDQLNEYLAKIHSDGTYDEIVDTWFGSDDSKKTVDIPAEGSRVLRYITASTMQPYSYIKDGTNAGLEIDIIARFCREYGYGLTIDNADFGSLIAGVSSGTYDLASGTIMITEERAQSVDFSDVYYTTNAVVVVRKESSDAAADTAKNTGFIDSIKDSFEKNFIREDRYKLIIDGVGTTCFMTVMSALFGSVLAFLVCMFRRTGSRLANAISNIYVKLLQGTPMVVLLMILYYIVFGKSGIPAMWVAVIGFTLNFGAYTSEIMRSGIESIDGGQREAALALGYSENQAFFKFIFPQAAVRFLPVYKGEVISLLKSTSVVGYIAIQDLTKMSDIIRSRTYEAFFPLIVTAVIYFILAWILSIVLKYILKRISPKRKKGAA